MSCLVDTQIFTYPTKMDSSSPKELPINCAPRILRDRDILLVTFDTLIWEQIHKKLENDPTTLHKFLNSSLSFNDIFQHHPKSVSLFPLAWPILAKKLDPPDYLEERSVIKSRCATILKFRTICGKWCDTVDAYYRQIYSKCVSEFENIKFPRNFTCNALFLLAVKDPFRYQWSVNAFLRHFDETHGPNCDRSPFIFGILHVNEVEHREMPLFQELLQKYGRHVWHFNAFFRAHNFLNSSPYSQLQSMFSHLPNIQSLSIKIAGYLDWSQNNNQLEQQIRANPLPNFPHLASLHAWELPFSVEMELRQKHTRNPKLDLYFRRTLPEYFTDNEWIIYIDLLICSLILPLAMFSLFTGYAAIVFYEKCKNRFSKFGLWCEKIWQNNRTVEN